MAETIQDIRNAYAEMNKDQRIRFLVELQFELTISARGYYPS